MRSKKTRRPTARPSRSPQKPSYTASQDEDDCNAEPETSLIDGNGILQEKKSGKGDGQRKKHKVSSLDGKKVDWLKNTVCLRCSRDGDLIFCAETGCPLAFHRKCMEFEPNFDEESKFFCPYCWFKLQVSRTLLLGEKVMLAEKALLDFMDSETVGEDEENWNDGRTEGKSPTEISPLGGKNKGEISDEVKNHQNGNGSKTLDEHDRLQGAVESECHGNANVHCSRKEKIQEAEQLNDTMLEEKRNDDKAIKEHDDELVGDALDGENVEEPSIASRVEERTILVDTPNGAKETLCQDAQETTMLSPEGNMTSRGGEAPEKVPETSDMDSETIAVRQKRFKHTCKRKVTQPHNAHSGKKVSIQPNKSLEAKSGDQNQKASSSENSKRPQESATALPKLYFAQDKRKRLYWTPEEEDALKEGVQKYSTEVNKNIPWRKILGFGNHIFNSTRTPGDLRDKWRKIVVKEF